MAVDHIGATRPTPEWKDVPLSQILASRKFVNNGQLKNILSYICKAAAEGRTPGEADIARDILDRRDFDPGTDTLVRVHMRRLRLKLEEYYQSEGAADTIHIEIPKQSYSPVPVAVPVLKAEPVPSPKVLPVWSSWQVRIALGATALIFGAAGWLFASVWDGRGMRETSIGRAGIGPSDFWKSLLGEEKDPVLAISTPLFFKTKEGYIRDFRLNFFEDLPSETMPVPSSLAWPVWATWISYSDAESAVILTRFLYSLGRSASLTNGRQIQLADLERRPAILLGHPRGMPVLADYFKSFNFYPYRAGNKGTFQGIGNRVPRPSELVLYRDPMGDDVRSVSEMAPDHGLITFSKPPNGPASLSIFSHRPLTTSLLVKWLIDPKLTQHLTAIGIRAPYGDFQILFKASVMNGVPMEAQAIATRAGH